MRSTPPASFLRRTARVLHHAVFHASRLGRASEIASWANAAGSFAIGTVVVVRTWSALSVHAAGLGLAAGIVAFAGLRLALTHRLTVWISAVFGTLTVALLGAALAWLFAHVIDSPAVPSIAAVLGAAVAAIAPAWSYAHLARRRAEHVRDSLIDPVSVPSSR